MTKKRTNKVWINLLVSAGFLVVYLLTRLLFPDRVHPSALFEAAGTLILTAVFLHRLEVRYFVGIVAFECISQYGGSMLRLYDLIPCYDMILHLVSGILLTFLGSYFLCLISAKKSAYCPPESVSLWFSLLFSLAGACV